MSEVINADQPVVESAPVEATPAEGAVDGSQATAPAQNEGQAIEQPFLVVKVGGEEHKLTREQAIEWASKGGDYTKKSQSLAEQRRTFDQDRETIIRNEMEKRQRLAQQERENQERQALGPAEQALLRTQELEQRIQDDKLSYALKDTLSKHPSVDEQALLIEATKRGIKNFDELESVASDLDKSYSERMSKTLEETISKGEHPSVKKFKEQVIAEYLKSKGSGPAPVAGSGGTSVPGSEIRKPKNMNEAHDIAISMLNAANGSSK